jgi:hypothetical protein
VPVPVHQAAISDVLPLARRLLLPRGSPAGSSSRPRRQTMGSSPAVSAPALLLPRGSPAGSSTRPRRRTRGSSPAESAPAPWSASGAPRRRASSIDVLARAASAEPPWYAPTPFVPARATSPVYAALLTAQGRFLYDFFPYRPAPQTAAVSQHSDAILQLPVA